MPQYDWDSEKEKMAHDLQEWTNYKERLLKSGYGNNVSGLKSWHVLGIGFCSRAVKGACSVELLTSAHQSYDGWVVVRSLWETALNTAWFAVQPTHAQRDELAERYVDYDHIQRLKYAKNCGLSPLPEWVATDVAWAARYGKDKRRWHGFPTTTLLMDQVEKVLPIEMPDRMGPLVDMAHNAARFARLHWESTSKYVHGEPVALARIWKSPAGTSGWVDAQDSVDPAWCLHDGRYAMICTCNLYAVSSPVLAGVQPPSFNFD